MKKNLEKLKDRSIVSSGKEKQIIEIIDSVTIERDFNEKAEYVTQIYKQIMEDKNAAKLVRVISCIATDSSQNRYQRPKSHLEGNRAEYVLGINVSEALVGAIIGSNTGKIEGDIFGALAGGIDGIFDNIKDNKKINSEIKSQLLTFFYCSLCYFASFDESGLFAGALMTLPLL